MNNYEENDFCPFPEISLKEYETAINEIYRVEMQNGKIKNDNFYSNCIQKLSYSIMRKFWNNKQYEISEEEFSKEFEKLLFGKLLDNMEKNEQLESIIDENGEVYYKITEKGKQVANTIINITPNKDKEK